MNKNIYIKIIIISFSLFLVSCSFLNPYKSFDEVSQSYLNRYGPPEDEYEFISDDYHVIEWWWWSQGVSVTFVNSEYDDVNGWKVDSIYYFDPIITYTYESLNKENLRKQIIDNAR